jgi:outer membrane protein OmpU
MKKVLFATTALVGFAGAASAEVTMSGWAEMGIIGGDRFATFTTAGPGTTTTVALATQYWNDVDIEFTLSGESDSGISFGARVDLDEAGNLGNTLGNQGTSMFISGDFGTLTLGDTDGAVDWAITDAGDIGNPGSISDDETTHTGYLGTFGDGGWDNQILRYDYSFGDFGFAISYEQAGVTVGSSPVGFVPDLPVWSDGAYAIGVKYALDLGGTTVNLGAGYHNTDFIVADQTILALGADASFGGGFMAGITYSQWSDVGGLIGLDIDHIGVGLGYESGPFAVHANWGQYDTNIVGLDVSGWGLAAAYDFGGGLSLNAGVGHDDLPAPFVDNTYWSLGMVMSF